MFKAVIIVYLINSKVRITHDKSINNYYKICTQKNLEELI